MSYLVTRNIVFILTICTIAAFSCSNSSKTMSPVDTKPKLVWSDEFNYQGLPDPTKWGYEEGFVRNNEPQYYTTRRLENCRVENGMLVIEARKENWQNANYTSASINTLGKQSWLYGRVEVRAKLPGGKGSWPAIWMMGENRAQVGWPKCGEIDIMEFLGKDSSSVYATVHYPDTTASGHGSKGSKAIEKNIPSEFHTFAAEWNKDSICFFIDDKKYFVFDIKKSQHTTYNPFQKNCYLLLNLALGRDGSWPGPTDDRMLPAKYYIDYVRVYQ